MNKIIAWIWTFSFCLNLAGCISGGEPSWLQVLAPTSLLMIHHWIEALTEE